MGKKYSAASAKVDRAAAYAIADAFKLLPETACARFDETVEVAGRLGVDTRQSDQQVRGTVLLPNGTGRSVRVLAIAKGEKEKEARDAGADHAGGDEMVEKIQGGWLDFDCIVATPDMMGQVGKLGKILGPKGLMPNPKLGTVTFDVKRAVTELKAGKVEYRVDKTGNLHVPIGKVSFGSAKLQENFVALMDAVIKAKPSASKGVYIKSMSVSTTMGPSIRLSASEVREIHR